MQNTSVIQCLEDISNKFAELCNLLKDAELAQQSLTIKQFAQALGLSVYKLKQIYESNELAIANPKRINGVEPKYTIEDVNYMRNFLKGK